MLIELVCTLSNLLDKFFKLIIVSISVKYPVLIIVFLYLLEVNSFLTEFKHSFQFVSMNKLFFFIIGFTNLQRFKPSNENLALSEIHSSLILSLYEGSILIILESLISTFILLHKESKISIVSIFFSSHDLALKA